MSNFVKDSVFVSASVCVTAGAVYLVLRRLREGRAVQRLRSLSSFEQEEVLEDGERTVLLGRFAWQPAGERALVKLSMRPTSLQQGLLSSLQTSLSSYSGAEYAYYDCRATLASVLLKPYLRPAYALEVIAPASEKQISRSRPQPGVFVIETAALYRDVVLPYIQAIDPASTSWIRKVLDLSKERERVLYNDMNPETGFLLNVDTKWKSHPPCVVDPQLRSTWYGHPSVEDLYCLAICHRADIRSLRDLNASHLPLLRHILAKGTSTVCEVYGVRPHELRVFVHYQPQFYHFHVHFTRLHNDLGCQVERAHLLQEIIETLEADGSAYAFRKTLFYQLKANDKLLAKIQQDT